VTKRVREGKSIDKEKKKLRERDSFNIKSFKLQSGKEGKI
jgi:hypothetical protein